MIKFLRFIAVLYWFTMGVGIFVLLGYFALSLIISVVQMFSN